MCNDLYCKIQAFELFRFVYGVDAKLEDYVGEWKQIRLVTCIGDQIVNFHDD